MYSLRYAILILMFLNVVTTYDVTDELIFANVLFRHGDRTPIDPYPNDPWRNLTFWPTGWGQLTKIGKQQHFELGKYLRNRYKNLISEDYNSKEVYIRSTDVDRTLMSALSNLAGLFPPKGDQVWNPDIMWQPIPVHTTAEKSDNILSAKKFCQTYDTELRKVKASSEYRHMDKVNSPLYKYLTQFSGRVVASVEGVENIFNCLFIETLYNKTLPDWTKQVYPDKMINIAARSFATNTYTKILQRYKSGPLLKEMLYHFINKTTKRLSPDRSLWIYSGHDTTVANLLNTLGVFEYHNPPYVACVMMELRRIKQEYYVQVFYRNESNVEPQLMNLPNCGTLCPLKKMLSVYADVIPDDWEAECHPSMLRLVGYGSDGDLIAAIAVVSISLLLVLIISAFVVGFTYWRNHTKPEYKHRYLRLDS